MNLIHAITDFVEKVMRAGSPDFVPPADRVATFDDGTSSRCISNWSSRRERLHALAPQHPEWSGSCPLIGVPCRSR